MKHGQRGTVLGSMRQIFGAGTSAGLGDAQLLERFLSGHGDVAGSAFEALVIRHGPMVLGVCRGTLRDAQDAQDAFQATFLVLTRRAASIRRRESLASWLFGVARRISSRARSDNAHRRAREREAAVTKLVEPGPRRDAEDLAALYEEIDRLPWAYREPVILCYLDGMTYEAAARHLRCPLGTLSVRLSRARERLRSRLTRRGVAAPGLLVAGRSVGVATLPAEFVGIAIRSGITGAVATGMVPAAVASLAGRMMTTMRLKAFGIGALAIGGLALAATASLAMKASAPRPTAEVQQPAAGKEKSWMRTLPGGATVELLGVSTHPAEARTWRKPDGTPLATPPYDRSGSHAYAFEGQKTWEFAVRIGDSPGKGDSYRWKVVPAGSNTTSGMPRDAKDNRLPAIAMLAVSLKEDLRACEVRFGVASGVWKTEIANGPEGSAQGREKLSAIFGTAREDGGRAAVTVSHDESEDDLRVVAVDLGGVEHPSVRSRGVGVRKFVQVELEFDLPLAKVKEFRLQSRPFEWAAFEGVNLDPRRE